MAEVRRGSGLQETSGLQRKAGLQQRARRGVRIAAGAGLALTLLGLGSGRAWAGSPAFSEQTGAANPLDGEDVGDDAAPALADLDGDGDLDALIGESGGGFRYFENTGSAASPTFVLQTGGANPLDGVDLGSSSAPALADLDRDGDLDLLAGEAGGDLFYLENTGSATTPVFAAASTNPFGLADVGDLSKPALGDLDGDGDLDLLVGDDSGAFSYFENTGNATSPAFTLQTGAADPLDGADVGDGAAPALVDADADGDLDLLVGAADGDFAYFENSGDAGAPSFASPSVNPFGLASVGLQATPAPGDLDGDGDADVVAGESDGSLHDFENALTLDPLEAHELLGALNPLDGLTIGLIPTPVLGDLDGDGDLDLLSGETSGNLRYLANSGGAASPAFAAAVTNPFGLMLVGFGGNSAAALGDLDADGDLDVLAADYLSVYWYFENTGSAVAPAFAAQVMNPFGLLPTMTVMFAGPTLGDLDADGDLDLLVGEEMGDFFYYENTGSATSPAFAAAVTNPFGLTNIGSYSQPTLGDVDGDGDLDVVAGDGMGNLRYFENTGSATSPSFAGVLTNPFGLVDIGYDSAVALGDLNADGHLDVVAGEGGGMFRTFYLPEPAQALMLGAGLACLALLRRLRQRPG